MSDNRNLRRVPEKPLTLHELCDAPVVLEALRHGRVVFTRFVSGVHDYSQPDQLINGRLPCIEFVAIDRFMSYTLAEGQRLEFDSVKGEATFVSAGVTYRIRPLTAAERNRLG